MQPSHNQTAHQSRVKRKNTKAGQGEVSRLCPHCGTAFKPASGKQRYCGSKCYQAAYKVANRDRIAKRHAVHRAANREKLTKRSAAYNAAHRDAIAKRRAAYYAANREKFAEAKRAKIAAQKVD